MHLSIERLQHHGRDILAIRQAPRQGAPRKGSYLLCRPIGQEATRTAAMYRVVSERLAREGCDVWRFDYHGTGDSPGDEIDQTLAQWMQDTLAVHEYMQGAGCTTIRWFGMGLGATIAAQAAARVPVAPAHLVLWEPVLNGPAYVHALQEGHRRELAREYGYTWGQLLAQRRVTEPQMPGDILGFDYGPGLAQELQQTRLLAMAPVLRRGIPISCGVQETQRSELAQSVQSGLLSLRVVKEPVDWMSSQALGAAVVPPDALQTLLATLN